MSNVIDKLTEYFRKFPGIGPRQAKRFVYSLLTSSDTYRKELSALILELKNDIAVCQSCFRFFAVNGSGRNLCPICADPNRDNSTLLIVMRDVDLENLEKSHVYHGKYFVLGGGVPILAESPEKNVRTKELLEIIKKMTALKEIVMAMSLTAEGENTEEYLRKILAGAQSERKIKLSTLGRGLSTGTELEYSDTETLKSAFQNRH
ncbi:MAG: toprim domain-containing protein [Candidatus Pacebacteria bacterium]|nr:toprim domain-containing protein [Candidatus Paceibacterota bacterium]